MIVKKYDDLIGKTFSEVVNNNNEELIFKLENDLGYKFYHNQDCCENVIIEDVVGDLLNLSGTPILEAEESSSDSFNSDYNYDSCTWTFYRFSTIKGTVTVRWLGTSNGYYSESVDFGALNE